MLKRPDHHPDAQLTLREAFSKHYETEHLARSSLKQIRYTLTAWERLTANPPVAEITAATIEQFKKATLEKDDVAPRTYNSRWTNIRAILRRLAEPHDNNPHGLGIIERVPYVRPCRAPWKLPRRISQDDLERFYLGAKLMRNPRRLGYQPALYWRTLVVVALTTGLRKADLFAIRPEDVDLEGLTLRFQAQKTGKADEFPLHPVAAAHIARIIGPRPRLFPGGGYPAGSFGPQFRQVQDAGKVSEQFTLHDLRRTGASEIERVRPGLGKVFLQHAPAGVTEMSYLNRIEELGEAIREMRIPLVWKHGVELTARAESRQQREVKALHVDKFAMPYRPLPEEWIFPVQAVGRAAGCVCYRGEWFSLTGQIRWQVLRALALADDPIGVPELATIGSIRSGGDVEKRVQAEIANLRKTLRRMFGFAPTWDPVRCVNRGDGDGGRWQLWFPPTMKENT
jgi:integrase